MATMVAADWENPSDLKNMVTPAIIAAAKINNVSENGCGLLPSMRNLLDRSSAAQRLDGVAV